jgi:hypothetical protein
MFPSQFLFHLQLSAKDTLVTFSTAVVEATPEQLSQECGVDYGPTLQLLNQLRTYTTILSDSAQRSMDLLSCKNIVPLYTSTVHEGTCENSITGAAWIFGCFFVISFFGMIMIMFRGAYYPIYYYEGKDWDSTTSDDEADLQEEMSEDNSEDYDESMVDTDVYDEEGLAKALDEDEEEEEETEYDQEMSVEEISIYTEGESNQ